MTYTPGGPEATRRNTAPIRTDRGPTRRLFALDEAAAVGTSGRTASPTVRVVVADGQALVRAGFRALMENAGRMTVMAEAATGEEALDLARRSRPDVVIMDASLPGLDCVEVTRLIVTEAGVAVMLLTAAAESDERIFGAIRAGARGLLAKDTGPDELVRAVRALARGDVWLSSGHARRLIGELVSRPQRGTPHDELLDQLTAREREVMLLVALGLGNDEIAERLVVSRATVKTHVSRAMTKLDVHDRARLVVLAYETGLLLPRQAPDRRRSTLALA
jgi:DNA-binding NarL/FixJ family response regulator